MTKKPFSQNPINRSVFASLLATALLGMMAEVQATPAYMQSYGAPTCTTCHTSGAYNSSEGRAGLSAYLASKSATCTAPQVLQNNVCVTPTDTTGAVSDSDRLFAYLETAYPKYFSPAGAASSTSSGGYYYRYYSATNAYIATLNGAVYYLSPNTKNQLISLGALSGWLTRTTPASSTASGYTGGSTHNGHDDSSHVENHHESDNDD